MSKPDPFYSEIVRNLAEILNETNLTEIEYVVNECKIRVARQAPTLIQGAVAPSPMYAPGVGMGGGGGEVTAPSVPPASSAATPEDLSKHPGALKSPMVGMAYMASSPGGAPFVTVGDRVSKGQTLLIIEAMKVMNQIKASQDGLVTHILCKDGDPIEFDQTLLIIE